MTAFVIILFLVAILGVLYLMVGYRFISYAFRRKDKLPEAMMPKEGKTPDEKNRAHIIRENRKAFQKAVEQWLPTRETEEMTVKSHDGLELHGMMIHSDRKSHRYVILCHGYMGSREWMLPHALVYDRWGYNTLVLDMRSHGKSEGKWIGMGWTDKDDVYLWVNEILYRDPYARIFLQGVSMGGATVMMASGLKLPPNVKGIIADCGYTSVWNVFEEQLAAMPAMPSHPVLMSASMMNRIINGWTLGEASSTAMLEKADPNLPMLFVQGADDAFVHMHMLDENFRSKHGLREKKVFPDTDHGNSYVRWPEEYFSTMKEFMERYAD